MTLISMFGLVGCGSENNGGSFVPNTSTSSVIEVIDSNESNSSKPVYSKTKAPYVGAVAKKEINGTLVLDFSEKTNVSQKMGLTESIQITNTVFAWTRDIYSVYDITEGAWLQSGERVVGNEYTYDVDCFLDGNIVLSGKLSLTMERNQNFVRIPTNIVSDSYFKITMDTQGKNVSSIVDTKFELNKDDTISFNAQLGSTNTLVFDDETTFNWTLDSYKVIKHLQNYQNYTLEEVVEDPGSTILLNQFKLSEKKKYSEKFNNDFEQKNYSFSVLIDEDGYDFDFNGNVEISLKDKNGVYKDIDSPLEKDDVIYVNYFNSAYLDFSLTFSEIEKEEVDLSDLFNPSLNFTIIQQFGINEDEAEVSFVIDDMGKNVESVRLSNIGIDNDIIVRNDDNYVVDILQENIESGDSFYLETQKEGQFNIVDFSYVIELEDGTIIENTVDLNIDLGEYIKD